MNSAAYYRGFFSLQSPRCSNHPQDNPRAAAVVYVTVLGRKTAADDVQILPLVNEFRVLLDSAVRCNTRDQLQDQPVCGICTSIPAVESTVA